MKRLYLTLFATLFAVITLCAQDFSKYFVDKTLRIDYNFSGNAFEQHIAVDELCVSPKWYGKRQNMDIVPMEGNGQIIVRELNSDSIIYRNSFSTLFQEWVTYPEAKSITKSFENVFLIPMPKEKVAVTVELYDNRRQVTAQLTHAVDPTDILIKHIGEKNITPYEVLIKGSDEKAIDIAYVAEGYTKKEMNIFMKDCREAVDALFAHEPFKSEKAKFNIVAVKAVSEESGTSEPKNGVWHKTALGSHFDTFYSDRYLTTLHLKKLHDVLAGIPYEHIIVLVNTEKYGGGGILNSYNLSMTHHKLFKPVVVHEFGHSFAGLADEYAYDHEPLEIYQTDIEPWEQNITTLNNFKEKWADMIEEDTPIPTPDENIYNEKTGLFEGAGYKLKGIYRSAHDCRMRTNENPEFCQVCQRAIKRIIDFYTK